MLRWTIPFELLSVAVGALDTILVFANQAEKVLLDGIFVLGVPRDGKAHVEVLRHEGGEDDSGRAEIPDSRGNQGYAFSRFDQSEDAGPRCGGVDDVGGEACRGAESYDAVVERRGHLAIAEDEALGGEGAD